MANSLAFFYILLYYALFIGFLVPIIRWGAEYGPLKTKDPFSGERLATNFKLNVATYLLLAFAFATFVAFLIANYWMRL